MSYHRILSLEIKNSNSKKYRINLVAFMIYLFFINNSYPKIFDKPMSFYDEARNNAENSIIVSNPPFYIGKHGWVSDSYLGGNGGGCVMYNIDYHILSTCRTTTYNSNGGFKNNEEYHNKQPLIITSWLYSPILGQYFRYVTLTQIETYKEESKKMIVNFYQLKDYKDDEYKKLDLNEESLKRLQEYGGGENSGILAMVLWKNYIGLNCEKIWGENRIACYNELDIHDYDRFYFNGNEMTKYDLKYYIREYKYDKIKKEGIPPIIGHKETYRNEMYEQTFNVKTIWEGKLKENETLTDLLKNMINNSKGNKILIMVPKDQRKLFIKTIKQIPNNYFKDKVGYVWFLSDSKHYNNIDKPKYNTKYDTKPNQKYDNELSRISNGNLKAKYGRYLTKERYSEDYVAPSIYGNNYNDKPEWQ